VSFRRPDPPSLYIRAIQLVEFATFENCRQSVFLLQDTNIRDRIAIDQQHIGEEPFP
jgi:hypothetical protein